MLHKGNGGLSNLVSHLRLPRPVDVSHLFAAASPGAQSRQAGDGWMSRLSFGRGAGSPCLPSKDTQGLASRLGREGFLL